MNILITGANFRNKGAQSMLFVVVDEIRKRTKDAKIYYATTDKVDLSDYRFTPVYVTKNIQDITLKKSGYPFILLKCFVIDCIKWVLGKKYHLWQAQKLSQVMPDIDVILDVSGFALGAKWSVETQEIYLNHIRLAKMYQKSIYLLPQSFGGFDYPEKSEFLLKEIEELLQYPEIIFAREHHGGEALEKRFKLNNIRLSYDLVLQNKGIVMDHIFHTPPEMKYPQLRTPYNVAVIPNRQCFRHGDEAHILNIYRFLIGRLLENGKEVYLFRHSKEDLAYCKLVYENLENTSGVHILEDDLSCLEYDEFIKQFEFIVASRFHSIVHAYRNTIPAIALGWEIKYQELTKAVGQQQYAFDITDIGIDLQHLSVAIDTMCCNHVNERETIHHCLLSIRESNCFDEIEELNA